MDLAERTRKVVGNCEVAGSFGEPAQRWFHRDPVRRVHCSPVTNACASKLPGSNHASSRHGCGAGYPLGLECPAVPPRPAGPLVSASCSRARRNRGPLLPTRERLRLPARALRIRPARLALPGVRQCTPMPHDWPFVSVITANASRAPLHSQPR